MLIGGKRVTQHTSLTVRDTSNDEGEKSSFCAPTELLSNNHAAKCGLPPDFLRIRCTIVLGECLAFIELTSVAINPPVSVFRGRREKPYREHELVGICALIIFYNLRT